jgi:Family of unknown function (DUF6527)
VARFSLRRWWRRRRPGPWRVKAIVPEADQIPDVLLPHGAALVKSGDALKWLVFDCPCGHGHRIMLNLDSERWPTWNVESQSPLTVWPSVDVDLNMRRCHYVMSCGHVEWIAVAKRTRLRSH